MPRTERRRLQKKMRNKARKQNLTADKGAREGPNDQSTARVPLALKRVGDMFHLKVPAGGNIYFRRHHFTSLAFRLPVAFALCYVFTSNDCFPYVIQGSIGPSMLPTIQFIGDLWVIETWAWHNFFGIEKSLNVGDVVLWKDPATHRVSCKRIVGLDGDEIARFGEYAPLYEDRDDLGIKFPTSVESSNFDLDWDNENEKQKKVQRTMVVPAGQVWLEGDCPLFSLDSRHFGPIPKSWLFGRLILRIWPLQRQGEDGTLVPNQLSQDRPVPFPTIESYLGKRFNFYKVPKETPP